MILEGKGFYLWKIKECENGDVNAIANTAKQAGLTHVLIKIADGVYKYNYDWNKKVDLVPPLVNAFRAKGISPWGWHYVRGDSPVAEARTAVDRVRDLGLDGYIIDAESEYKGRYAAARTFMDYLRRDLPNTPIALSSYRYPSYHPQLPWRDFLEKCDLTIPQVYWQGANNPDVQLDRSVREFQGMTPLRPIVPTGAAYTEHNWTPKPQEIIKFLNTAQSLNLSAANFWEWSAARNIGLWQTVADFVWQGAGPVKDIAEQYIDALNTRSPDEILKLYNPSAVHVNASRTVQGHSAIRSWYAQLLFQTLPNPTFAITGFSGSGNSRHVTWTATSNSGRVLNGNDTFGLMDGKISYHYTFFTVTN